MLGLVVGLAAVCGYATEVSPVAADGAGGASYGSAKLSIAGFSPLAKRLLASLRARLVYLACE